MYGLGLLIAYFRIVETDMETEIDNADFNPLLNVNRLSDSLPTTKSVNGTVILVIVTVLEVNLHAPSSETGRLRLMDRKRSISIFCASTGHKI